MLQMISHFSVEIPAVADTALLLQIEICPFYTGGSSLTLPKCSSFSSELPRCGPWSCSSRCWVCTELEILTPLPVQVSLSLQPWWLWSQFHLPGSGTCSFLIAHQLGEVVFFFFSLSLWVFFRSVSLYILFLVSPFSLNFLTDKVSNQITSLE